LSIKKYRQKNKKVFCPLFKSDDLYDRFYRHILSLLFLQYRRKNEWIILGKPFDPEKLYRGMRSICHQTMFVKKELHNKFGLYDTSLKIGMDYDFLCRIAHESFSFHKEIFICMYPDGVSTTDYLAGVKDIAVVYKKYFGNSIKLYLWQFRLKILYYLLNTKTGKFLFKIKKWLHLENM
jgi:hypothetical protein